MEKECGDCTPLRLHDVSISYFLSSRITRTVGCNDDKATAGFGREMVLGAVIGPTDRAHQPRSDDGAGPDGN
jgi:hypothetical protein